MSWWLWIAFCTVSAGIFLYPSKFNLLIAQQAARRGRKAGLISAFGAAIGLGMNMTIAIALIISWTLFVAPISEFLGWVGMAWLIMIGLWTLGTVPYRAALPDNDNLPAGGLIHVFVSSVQNHVLSSRFLGFFLALTVQFSIAPNGLTIVDFINMQIATLLIAFSSYSLIAFFPEIPITWLKNIGVKIASRKPQNKTLIAGKLVKARYRKIAA